MKNNLNFILPKIAGFTVLAGVGAMLLFVIFKILMVALVISVGVFAVKSAVALINQARERAGYNDGEYVNHLGYDYEPQRSFAPQKRELAIIPIR